MAEQTDRAFCEPWQAQVFALAVQLSEAGHFTWTEWSEHFGAHLKAAAAARGPLDEFTPMPAVDSPEYYDVWLDALESLLVQRGLARAGELAELKEAWTEAYLQTPHGMPVELGGDHDHDGHAHHHHHDHRQG
jgi:nitrile hydratase accessory protein